MTLHTRIAEIELLRDAIRQSGLSLNQYARQVLVRDERTIRRWLSGERHIPQAVLDLIQRTKGAA